MCHKQADDECRYKQFSIAWCNMHVDAGVVYNVVYIGLENDS